MRYLYQHLDASYCKIKIIGPLLVHSIHEAGMTNFASDLPYSSEYIRASNFSEYAQVSLLTSRTKKWSLQKKYEQLRNITQE
uniref:AlNc14C183G8276 protein n=1 Tax=Albugo laibachii Nc14 TaxID=890382 RepID=F0W1T8_9STRA|nr:AlNc14C8G1018 [Albugo laibachii Nc14]CCA23178.1 AlNc14C183G8276 [Albugo laibachii Nc14]|eukprot:CCA23178.1 AlNc14C183G8276 [Albugo laibachii Nc14]